MRGLAAMLVGLAAGAAGAPSARAGTYDVVSCGAPGAGGVNRAWRPEASAYPPNAPDPASYVIADQCPAQLSIQTAAPAGNAPFLTGGNWIFDAPAGTRLTRLETWRFGVKLRTGPNDPDGDTWRIFARDQGAQIIGGVFGETCTTKPGDIGCQFGSDTGISDASHAVYPINVASISYTISCEYIGGCPRYFKEGANEAAIATIKLFGTRVTVSDSSVPSLKAGGPLLSAGWRRPGDVLTYDAGDNVGVRAVRLDIGGRTRRVAASCDYHRPIPCATRRAATMSVPPGTPDGIHSARIVAEDAAGNEKAVPRQIMLDGTPPTARLQRARGKTIVIAVGDATSGVASAGIEVRNRSNEPYRNLAGTLAGGKLRATLDRGNASRIDMRVTVRDAAGNVTQGNPTRLSVTSAKFGRRTRRVRSNRVKVPFGRRATIRGRLLLSGGEPLAGQTIGVVSTVRRRGAHAQFVGAATTGRSGRFAIRIPAGPSRRLSFVFAGGSGALGNTRGITYRVPASSTIHASRIRLSGSGRVRFSGRLRTRGERIAGHGLVLVLQGRERGHWRTFDDSRTNGKGRWHATYNFSGRPGRYPIRVRIRHQTSYPFELGYSRALTVRVG